MPEAAPLPQLHRMEVAYFNTDDGVWLSCSCGWTKNLGYGKTPQEFVQAADQHFRTFPESRNVNA